MLGAIGKRNSDESVCLATLVALHFTPVYHTLAHWVKVSELCIFQACKLVSCDFGLVILASLVVMVNLVILMNLEIKVISVILVNLTIPVILVIPVIPLILVIPVILVILGNLGNLMILVILMNAVILVKKSCRCQ